MKEADGGQLAVLRAEWRLEGGDAESKLAERHESASGL